MKSKKNKTIPTIEEIEMQIHHQVADTIAFCINKQKTSIFRVEKVLQTYISDLACLFFQLFIMSFHDRMDYSKWLSSGLYYKGALIGRTIKTIYGEVRYWRSYLIRKNKSGGFYPLDAEIGLTKDGFTPLVLNLATKLATRVSFGVSVTIFRCFYGWSPSTEAVEHLVLGMGRNASAYMEQVNNLAEEEGDVLVIEVDGKATPTATEAELEKRRGKRKKEKSCCQRHRGKNKRKNRDKIKKRKKGDKSKNGRSITLVVMYTLKKGEDGKLHGPINKKVWGSYAPRKVMLEWALRQAIKRGFHPDGKKHIHIAMDGEKCLYDGFFQLFPKATFVLDIRHLEEKIWKVGRLFYKEGSKNLKEWVEKKVELLYTGRAPELVEELKKLKLGLSARAKRDKKKRKGLCNLIKYMECRLEMMHYQKLIEEDLVIATGIVEGAARYVIGERMDCSGMRWIPERAESLLRLRCIELNGDWDDFFEWGYKNWIKKMGDGENIIIRQEKPDDLPDINFLNAVAADYYEDYYADAS